MNAYRGPAKDYYLYRLLVLTAQDICLLERGQADKITMQTQQNALSPPAASHRGKYSVGVQRQANETFSSSFHLADRNTTTPCKK